MKGVNDMKKTNWMVAIEQIHPYTNTSVHFERRVYEDENGIEFVKINGGWFEVHWLATHNHNIEYFS